MRARNRRIFSGNAKLVGDMDFSNMCIYQPAQAIHDDYIHYSLNPDSGYCTDDDGTRKVVNTAKSNVWYGHIDGSGSYTIPDTFLETGQYLFEFKWNDTGEMILRIGDAGDEKVSDSDVTFVLDSQNNHRGLFVWSDVTLRYEHSDLAWTDDLIANMADRMCFFFLSHLNPFNIVDGADNIVDGEYNIVDERG